MVPPKSVQAALTRENKENITSGMKSNFKFFMMKICER